jgi:hypothetical protein
VSYAGVMTGPDVSTGTVDYSNGAVSVTFSSNVDNKAVVVATYSWDFPLKFKYSVPAGLAASAHLAIDVQDTLAELAGQFMKMERDNLGIKMIVDNAPAESTLNFTATPSTYYDRQSVYADIELKLNEAESIIQDANGRGGVSWVLAGQNAANIFRNSKGLQPAPIVAPIGAHIIG